MTCLTVTPGGARVLAAYSQYSPPGSLVYMCTMVQRITLVPHICARKLPQGSSKRINKATRKGCMVVWHRVYVGFTLKMGTTYLVGARELAQWVRARGM